MTVAADLSTTPGASTPLWADDAVALAGRPIIPELLAGLGRDARRRLHAALADGCAPSVVDDLVGWHDALVARVTNPVLMQRFDAFRLVHDPFWRPRAQAPGDAHADAPRGRLDAYIAWESLEDVLAESGPYPEMGRLVASIRANWLAASVELVERVTRHRGAIAALLGLAEAELPPLGRCAFGISDAHAGGRSAAILWFGSRRVVYKPRALRAEQVWGQIAQAHVEAALGVPLEIPETVSLDGFGFMSFVETPSCADRAAVQRCYRRYGALMALAHGFGLVDLHHENVIVSGEHPVVIDAEPLFRGRLALSDQGNERLGFERSLSLDGLDARESVLELGMLPMRLQPLRPKDAEGPAEEYEIGALSAYLARPRHDLLPCGLGSDELQQRPYPVVARLFPNLPTLDGAPALPRDFDDEIVAGFRRMHRYLRRERGRFLAPGGILDQLADVPVRLLARPTMDYTLLLTRSLAAGVLKSTEDRRALIRDDLGLLCSGRFDTVASLVDAEVESMMAADVPRFELRADAADCAYRMYQPPVEAARTRLAGLDDLDAALQSATIREALLARQEGLAATIPASVEPEVLSRQALRYVEACVAAREPVGRHRRWIYASYLDGLGATMNHADVEGLYEGGAGTAVLVAEAARVAGVREWGDAAARLFDPLLAGAKPVSVRRSGGLARGLGGLVYALVRVADAAGREALADLAVRLLLEHGHGLAVEEGLDELLYGRAGLLLATLAVHRRRPHPGLLDVADAAAGALMARARPVGDGVAWPLATREVMPNVSHGNAGIAMALARWAQARHADEGADFARRALAADDHFWDPDERGWVDVRVEAVHGAKTNWGWCNGRSGALLARAAVGAALGDREVSRLAEAAAAAEASDVLCTLRPGLCCGTPGAVDALLAVGARDAHLACALRGALETAATEALPSHYSTQMPALFSGSGGLAFALLRAAHPETVPSLLWFA